MFMAADEFPLPYEYRFFVFDGLVSEPPEDVGDRTVIYLDCGNIDRSPLEVVKREDAHILNIDHHHDNTRFGTVNHVVEDASCTAEIVWDLMRDLGVATTPAIADALYVGLVTDTGRFMYENTGTRAHVMAAELIAAGVDVNAIYRRLYEEMPFSKLALLARGLANVDRYDDGRLTITRLTLDDYAAGRRRGELLRGRDRPPALGRAARRSPRSPARCSTPTRHTSRRSRCAPPTATSTSRSSRAPAAAAGTGRPPASRRTSTTTRSSSSCARRSPSQLVIRLVDNSPRARRRTTSSRACGASCRRPKVGPRGHAGPVRDRAAARPASAAPRARSAGSWGCRKTLRGRRPASAGRRRRATPRASSRETGRMPPTARRCRPARFMQRPPAYSGGQDRRRARVQEGARAARRSRCPSAR